MQVHLHGRRGGHGLGCGHRVGGGSREDGGGRGGGGGPNAAGEGAQHLAGNSASTCGCVTGRSGCLNGETGAAGQRKAEGVNNSEKQQAAQQLSEATCSLMQLPAATGCPRHCAGPVPPTCRNASESTPAGPAASAASAAAASCAVNRASASPAAAAAAMACALGCRILSCTSCGHISGWNWKHSTRPLTVHISCAAVSARTQARRHSWILWSCVADDLQLKCVRYDV